jgi:hypothetical protein
MYVSCPFAQHYVLLIHPILFSYIVFFHFIYYILEIARGKPRTQRISIFCENCLLQNFRDFSSRDLGTIPYFWVFLMFILALIRIIS